MFYSLFCLDSCIPYVFKNLLPSSFLHYKLDVTDYLLCFHVFYCSLIAFDVPLVRFSLLYKRRLVLT